MRLTLIIPPAPTMKVFALPLSITQIKSYLEGHGCSVSTVDLNILTRKAPGSFDHIFSKIDGPRIKNFLDTGRDRYIGYISRFFFSNSDLSAPSAMGFSITGYQEFLMAVCLAREIKTRAPHKKIIFGGHFLTVNGYAVLEDFDFIDYAIWGQGEIALLMLLRHLNGEPIATQDIPGLIFRKDGKIIRNKEAPLKFSENSLPDFSDLPLDLYLKYAKDNRFPLPYFISSGCVNRCAYCSIWPGASRIMVKPPEKVVSELKELVAKYAINHIDFVADSLSGENGYLEALCDAIMKDNLDIHWGTQISLNESRPGLFKKLKKAGCEHVQVGIESGSQSLLKKMRKMIQLDSITRILEEIHENKITLRANFIAGMPTETREDFQATCDFIIKNARLIDIIYVDSFIVYKSCAIFHNPSMYNIAEIKTETDVLSKYLPYCEHREHGHKTFDTTRKLILVKTRLMKKIARENGIAVG